MAVGRVRKLHHETQWSLDVQSIREEERTRIAREIHDELSQWLAALKIETFLIKKAVPIEDIAIQEKLSAMAALINKTVKAVRRIVTELRPGILNYLGLVAAVEWQAKEFEKRTGIRSQILSSGNDLNLEINLSTNIFRVYQEALNNVARHAKATKVDTFLEHNDTHISLIIKDNGRGFDFNKVKTASSFGLIGMRERALMFRGELHIESNKSTGTVITLKVPLVVESENPLQ
ncbi:MAG TPA: sensor histidine kinase [Chryseolinea sp.]|nr:sensor histidine kinase [Chryseolinea sp.]